MFHPQAFQTGKVLEKGETEIGVHLPLNATIARGFSSSGLELRLTGGLAGFEIGGINLALSKALTKSSRFFTSGTADAELFGNQEEKFAGMRFAATYALGYYPNKQFGIYAPLKVGYLFYDLNGKKGNGIYFTPGLGVSFEGENFVVRLGGNVPVPFSIDDNVKQFPYAALQMMYRWR